MHRRTDLHTLISIHAPLAGSDSLSPMFCRLCPYFNPRSPCGERLLKREGEACYVAFQSTLPLRGATHRHTQRGNRYSISIHAPLAGSDSGPVGSVANLTISIHAPLAGSDLPARPYTNPRRNFNPRSPCGERPLGLIPYDMALVFQSTLPLRGATLSASVVGLGFIFQSTLPLRGATGAFPSPSPSSHISIHAPLAGSDFTRRVVF